MKFIVASFAQALIIFRRLQQFLTHNIMHPPPVRTAFMVSLNRYVVALCPAMLLPTLCTSAVGTTESCGPFARSERKQPQSCRNSRRWSVLDLLPHYMVLRACIPRKSDDPAPITSWKSWHSCKAVAFGSLTSHAANSCPRWHSPQTPSPTKRHCITDPCQCRPCGHCSRLTYFARSALSPQEALILAFRLCFAVRLQSPPRFFITTPRSRNRIYAD